MPTDYRLPRATAPDAPVTNAPPKSSPVGAGAAGALFGISGWAVAVVLLLMLGQAKGCSIPWPNVGPKAGPRGVVILRESAEDTPALGRLFTSLRNPPHSEYLSSKKHRLDILDDDQSAEWTAALQGVRQPAMAIYDLESRKILDKRPVDVDAGAAGVMAAIKAKGG